MADTTDVKAARRDLMHKNGDVDEALMQEAHRCLVAFKSLGVVMARRMLVLYCEGRLRSASGETLCAAFACSSGVVGLALARGLRGGPRLV